LAGALRFLKVGAGLLWPRSISAGGVVSDRAYKSDLAAPQSTLSAQPAC
jgi:hypothetical protein